MGNEKRRSIRERRGKITTKEKSQRSYQCKRFTQVRRDSTSEWHNVILSGCKKNREQGTGAKLESFVIMKTRPVHRGVKKWAERVLCDAKSVVGLIKIGRKKNKEILERAKKRQRDD